MNIQNLYSIAGKKIIFSKTLNSHAVIDETMKVLFTGDITACIHQITTD